MVELDHVELLGWLIEIKGKVLERWWLSRLCVVVIEEKEVVAVRIRLRKWLLGLSC
jgi:hypothetical protein